jgi:hypothetical protein
MFTSKPIEASRYFNIDAQGAGKSYALAHARKVHAQWFIEPTARTIAVLSRSFEHHVSRNSDQLQLYRHNVIFNVAPRPRPRPRDPAIPLAGTVFDPRRYRRL